MMVLATPKHKKRKAPEPEQAERKPLKRKAPPGAAKTSGIDENLLHRPTTAAMTKVDQELEGFLCSLKNIKEQKSQVKEDEEELQDALLDFMVKHKIDRYRSHQFGSITEIKPTSTVRLDQDKLKTTLLIKGVKANTLSEAWEECSIVGEKRGFLKYTPPGGNRKKDKNGKTKNGGWEG